MNDDLARAALEKIQKQSARIAELEAALREAHDAIAELTGKPTPTTKSRGANPNTLCGAIADALGKNLADRDPVGATIMSAETSQALLNEALKARVGADAVRKAQAESDYVPGPLGVRIAEANLGRITRRG